MTIAVDFDGTIVEYRYPAIGAPVPFALETLSQLSLEGHKIILWTVREGKSLDDAVEYLRQNGITLYAVNSEYPNASWSGSGVSRKIKADVYIDDCNLGGLPDWCEIYEMISCHKMEFHNRKNCRRNTERNKGFLARIRERCRKSRNNLKL